MVNDGVMVGFRLLGWEQASAPLRFPLGPNTSQRGFEQCGRLKNSTWRGVFISENQQHCPFNELRVMFAVSR